MPFRQQLLHKETEQQKRFQIRFPVSDTGEELYPDKSIATQSMVTNNTVTLIIHYETLRRKVLSHMRLDKNEPWHLLFSEHRNLWERIQVVQKAEDGVTTATSEHTQDFAEMAIVIHDAIDNAASQPFAISYRLEQDQHHAKRNLRERWILLLNSGAFAVLEWQFAQGKRSLVVVNCYFLQKVWEGVKSGHNITREHALKKTVKAFVKRYADAPTRRSNHDDSTFHVPVISRNRVVSVWDEGGVRERHRGPVFWTNSSWGFFGGQTWTTKEFAQAFRSNQGGLGRDNKRHTVSND